MEHLECFDNFKTKKSIDKKRVIHRDSKNIILDDFILPRKMDNKSAIVLETNYRNAKVLYNGEVIIASILINYPCNQLIFTGDEVILDNHNNILHVLERKSILSRNHKDGTRHSNVLTNKIVAVNLDIAVIVVSAFSPALHSRFIDRYLMVLQNQGIKSIICLNKSDLKTQQEEDILDIYRSLGMDVIETSALNNEGIDKL